MNTRPTSHNYFFKQAVNTFLFCLLFSAIIYESTNMSSALRTLQNGEPLIALLHFLSIVYIAGITTALILVLNYYGRHLLNFHPTMIMKNSGRKNPQPELAVVNPRAVKEIIDNMQISKN